MQERGRDGGIIQPLFGQDGGDRDGMGEIGLARMAFLPLMHPLRIRVGAPQERLIGFGIVVSDERDQVVGVYHALPNLSARSLTCGPVLP